MTRTDSSWLPPLAVLALAAVPTLPTPAYAAGILGVGSVREFPAAVRTGAPITFEIWQWGKDPAAQKRAITLRNGMKISLQSMPKNSMVFKFHIPTPHDTAACTTLSSDSFDRIAWGPEKLPLDGSAQRLYRAYPEDLYFPP
ncbi:MAG TPA: hypothetical protein VLJ39_08470, partial [Tepidisphaeraceae bacterium]|nr:hypothetical protein [Tepidisphaeraceae bacterium]